MNRKTKLPLDHELRKRLINFLFKEGCSMLYVIVLIGYDVQQLSELNMILLNHQLKEIYEGSDENRKKIIDEHIKRMEDKKKLMEIFDRRLKKSRHQYMSIIFVTPHWKK